MSAVTGRDGMIRVSRDPRGFLWQANFHHGKGVLMMRDGSHFRLPSGVLVRVRRTATGLVLRYPDGSAVAVSAGDVR